MRNMGQYAKAIAAVVGAGLTAAISLYPHATWIPIAIAALTPIGVYAIPNSPKKQDPEITWRQGQAHASTDN